MQPGVHGFSKLAVHRSSNEWSFAVCAGLPEIIKGARGAGGVDAANIIFTRKGSINILSKLHG
jgi:hypothetical protein